MKAFQFKLDQALRWREAQCTAQKARVASAAAAASELESALARQRSQLQDAQQCLAKQSDSRSLQSFAAYRTVAVARIRQSESQIPAARQRVALELQQLVEANKKVQVLEKLRTAHRLQWQQDFDRELTAFADEAFLGRRR